MNEELIKELLYRSLTDEQKEQIQNLYSNKNHNVRIVDGKEVYLFAEIELMDAVSCVNHHSDVVEKNLKGLVLFYEGGQFLSL